MTAQAWPRATGEPGREPEQWNVDGRGRAVPAALNLCWCRDFVSYPFGGPHSTCSSYHLPIAWKPHPSFAASFSHTSSRTPSTPHTPDWHPSIPLKPPASQPFPLSTIPQISPSIPQLQERSPQIPVPLPSTPSPSSAYQPVSGPSPSPCLLPPVSQ